MEKAILPLSADPLTSGHLYLIKKACNICNSLTVAILQNNTKLSMFTLHERVSLMKEAIEISQDLQEEKHRIEVIASNSLLATVANQLGIFTIIRGVRSSEDWNYEGSLEAGHSLQIGGSELTFVYLRSNHQHSGISASLVKSIFLSGGNISALVPLHVKKKMENNAGIYKIIVSGCIASGKSEVSKTLSEKLTVLLNDAKKKGKKHYGFGNEEDVQVHVISFDAIVAQLYKATDLGKNVVLQNVFQLILSKSKATRINPAKEESKQPRHQDSISALKEYGSTKEAVKAILTNSSLEEAKKLISTLQQSLAAHVYENYANIMRAKKGIYILEMPMAAEYSWLHESNNAVILVEASEQARSSRLKSRGLSQQEITRMLQLAGSNEAKSEMVAEVINNSNYGTLLNFDNETNNSGSPDKNKLDDLAKKVYKYFFSR